MWVALLSRDGVREGRKWERAGEETTDGGRERRLNQTERKTLKSKDRYRTNFEKWISAFILFSSLGYL